MKRFTMVLAMVLMVTMPLFAERVTPETARKVAATFLNNNGAKSAQLTDLTKEAGFPNLYIFNGNPGFVVMAADDCVQPILGYSLDGKFLTKNMPNDVIWWLNGYNDQIQDAIDNHMKTSSDVAKQWKDLINGDNNGAKTKNEVGPLTTTKWDQSYPYNYYCPSCNSGGDGGHVYTGCVATAMAQVLKYHNTPLHGIGSHGYTHSTYGYLFANFEETTYDWDNMPNQLYSNSNQAQIEAIATLIYHCGVAVEMDYGPDGSGAYANYIAPALKNYFNLSESTTYVERRSYSNANWIALMRTELDNNRPIVYGGVDHPTNPQSGHSFVCDGYGKDGYSNYYFNFNWGWSGYYNGYFSIDNMTPGGSGAGGGNHNYSYLQDAVIGIKPDYSSVPAPDIFQAELQENNGIYNVSLTWSEVSGASGYKIYRNNSSIATISENTLSYLDENIPYGTHVYYVKSIDLDGNLSAPSNSQTISLLFPGPVVTDLNATVLGNDISLSWTALESETVTLQYVSFDDCHYINSFGLSAGDAFYWGVRFPASQLINYAGMALTTITEVFYNSDGTDASDYYLYVVQGTGDAPSGTTLVSGKLSLGPYRYTISVGPFYLDFTQDLWIIFMTEDIDAHPVVLSDIGTENGNYYSFDGQSWGTIDLTWPIAITITDGTYTYNLYRNGEAIATEMSETTYTDQNRNNKASFYTVKTNYYGGESAASNGVGYALGEASIGTLELTGNDIMTVTSNSTLTVSNLSSASSSNLILENGAQLVSSSMGVKATVEKDIKRYTADDNGWYFIASPVTESITPNDNNGLLTNNFDLYLFDQSQTSEWRNYEANSFSTLNHKTGYLYANSGSTTLNFAGTLSASAEATSLDYDATATFKGFNLIGNPYPCNTTITNDFYIIDGNTVTLAENGRTITPCEGVFVKATDEGQTVTFNKVTSAKGSNPRNCIDLVVSQGKATTDRARVRFGEGIGMEKFSLDEKHSQITLWQNGQDYAVAYADGQTEMPVNFKAVQNGTYTLTIDVEDLDLDYLHLIDNMTGEDVDLLATPSYTFKGKTTDYASRFRLLFAPICEDTVDDNGIFAYVDANNNIIISGSSTGSGTALLQIMDMTGRVIVCSDLARNVSTAGITPGVYVLRLIDGETIRTQKIVLR